MSVDIVGCWLGESALVVVRKVGGLRAERAGEANDLAEAGWVQAVSQNLPPRKFPWFLNRQLRKISSSRRDDQSQA